MTRRKKSNVEVSPTSTSLSEHYVRMDIDIQALRANNKDLVQSVAKLKQDKALMQKEHTSLQEEYFKLNSKYVNLKNIFSTIDTTIKLTFSNMADGVNHLAKIMHLCSVGHAVSGLNKEPKTLTVKPHMVNGTVIQNPTITLSRFNDSDSHVSLNNTEQQQQQNTSHRQQINQDFVPESEIQPSTSRGSNENISDFFNNSYNQTEEEEIVTDNVSRHLRRNTFVLDNPEEENEEEENDMLDEDDEVTDHTYCQRLITINEESEDFVNLNSTGTVTDRVREIRIYLSPLPVEHTKDDDNSATSFVGRSSSLSAEASNSILNSTLLNESNKSTDKIKFLNSINISMPSPSNSRFEGFDSKTMDGTINASKETNRPSCSFMNNVSSIMRCESMQDDDSTVNSSGDTEDLKAIAMKSLGLMEKTREVRTSTPVVPIQRTSKRLIKKSMDLSEAQSKISPITSNITKRKVSSGTMLPQVIIKRLNLDQSGSHEYSLTNILDTTPMTSISDIKNKSRKRKPTGTTSKLESDTQNTESVKRTVQTKGKENRKKLLVVSTQSIKSSPRPRRAARPTVLRESSLKKKMRRSR